VCIGVRAKYIRIDDGSTKDMVHILGNVEKKSIDGLNNYISVRIGNDRISVKAENAVELNHGDGIRLNFSRRNAFLFRCPLDSIDLETMPLALLTV
jgi:ABC-type sugar transport system ATPase subunit